MFNRLEVSHKSLRLIKYNTSFPFNSEQALCFEWRRDKNIVFMIEDDSRVVFFSIFFFFLFFNRAYEKTMFLFLEGANFRFSFPTASEMCEKNLVLLDNFISKVSNNVIGALACHFQSREW